MPVPQISIEHRVIALENALAQATADKVAKDAFITQLVETIETLDQQIAELTSDEGKQPEDES